MTNKYNAEKTTVDGIRFDSKAEAERYTVLRDMERHGVISDLRLQAPIELIPACKVNGKTQRAIIYKADFVYQQNGQRIVEDVKGFETKEYKIKKKILLWRYPDIAFYEIKK